MTQQARVTTFHFDVDAFAYVEVIVAHEVGAEGLDEVKLVLLKSVLLDPVSHPVLLYPILLELSAGHRLNHLHDVHHRRLRRHQGQQVQVEEGREDVRVLDQYGRVLDDQVLFDAQE